MNSLYMLYPFLHVPPTLNPLKLVLKVIRKLQIQWPLLGPLWTSSLPVTLLTNTCCSFSFHESFPWIPTPLTKTLVYFVLSFFHQCYFFYLPPTAAQRSGFCSVLSSKIFCKEFTHLHGFILFPQKSPKSASLILAFLLGSGSYDQWTISRLCLDTATRLRTQYPKSHHLFL